MPLEPREILAKTSLQQVRIRTAVCVEKGTPVNEVLTRLQTQKRGCALIQDNGKLVGIFTERDLLHRVIGAKQTLSTPVDDVMSPDPQSLEPDASIVDAITLMSQKGYRHVPLVNNHGAVLGFVSVRDILEFLSDLFPYEVYNLPPDPHQINKTAEGA